MPPPYWPVTVGKRQTLPMPIAQPALTKWGWGFDKYTAECNTGSGPKMPQWVKPYFKYVLPVLIAVILVQGLL